MGLKQIFKDAAVLIRKGWTTKVIARNKYGLVESPISPDACSWCALGAIQKASYDNCGINFKIIDEAGNLVRNKVKSSVSSWNDYIVRNGEEVAKMFDELSEENL